MNIISIDLPWKKEKKRHRITAIADRNGNVKIVSANDDNELSKIVCESADLESIILLDVPIDGCDNFKDGHFRPIDMAIARQTLPALPASKAGIRGKSLKESLEKANKRLKVYEIYPYAIYKFLAYLKYRKLLQHLRYDRFDALLDEKFRTYWPPKYKREKKREKRLRNLEYLYSLLMDADIGLSFRTPLYHPDASSNLGQVADEYDACLGAIAGIHLANKSGYAFISGDSHSGNILLLADRWLAEQLGREVLVYQPGKRS